MRPQCQVPLARGRLAVAVAVALAVEVAVAVVVAVVVTVAAPALSRALPASARDRPRHDAKRALRRLQKRDRSSQSEPRSPVSGGKYLDSGFESPRDGPRCPRSERNDQAPSQRVRRRHSPGGLET
jgi:Ni/Co efflux regulator RcnB